MRLNELTNNIRRKVNKPVEKKRINTEVYDKDIESIKIDEDDSSVEGKSNSDSSPRSDRIFPKKMVP